MVTKTPKIIISQVKCILTLALCNLYLLKLCIVSVLFVDDRYRCTVSSVWVFASCSVGGTLTEEGHTDCGGCYGLTALLLCLTVYLMYKSWILLFQTSPRLWNRCFPLMYSRTIIWWMIVSLRRISLCWASGSWGNILMLSSLSLTWCVDKRTIKQKDLSGSSNLVVMSVSWILY